MFIYPLLFALAFGQAPAPDKPALSVQVGLFALSCRRIHDGFRHDGRRARAVRRERLLELPLQCRLGQQGAAERLPRNAWRVAGQVIDISSDECDRPTRLAAVEAVRRNGGRPDGIGASHASDRNASDSGLGLG